MITADTITDAQIAALGLASVESGDFLTAMWWTGTEWSLSSGRPCSRRMLAAIDGLAMTFEAVSK
jgi:hypothetical protein